MGEVLHLPPTSFTLISPQNLKTTALLRESVPLLGITEPVNFIRCTRAFAQAEMTRRGFSPPWLLNDFPPDQVLLIPIGGGNRVRVAIELGLPTIPCVEHQSWESSVQAQLPQQLKYRDWYEWPDVHTDP